MKIYKIALLLAITLSSTSLSAENLVQKEDIHYFGEYHVGYGVTSSVNGHDTYTGNVMLGTVQGIQYKQYFQLGIGVDGQMLTHYYKNQKLRYGVLGYGDIRGSYPLTDDFRVTLGGSFGVSYSIEPSGGGTPFYMEIGPGVIYKHLLFKAGLQKTGSGDGSNHLFVKLGFHF